MNTQTQNLFLTSIVLIAMPIEISRADAPVIPSESKMEPRSSSRTLSEAEVSAKVNEDVTTGIQAISNDPASLLQIIKRLRPYGYGVVDESPETSSGRGRGSRGGQGRGGRGGQGHGESGGHGAPMDDAQMRARFDSFDQDRDGVWKGSEINAYMSDQPASNDGEVTFEEYKAAWEILRSGRRGGGNRGGSRGGSQNAGRTGGADSRSGHSHGGQGRPSAEVRASADAKFITSLDLNRDRKISQQEISQAVAADVKAQLNPEMQEGDSEATVLSDRMKQRTQSRLLARGRAIRAILILSSESPPEEKVGPSILQGHLPSEREHAALWKAIAGDEQEIATKSLYRALTRAPENLVTAIR